MANRNLRRSNPVRNQKKESPSANQADFESYSESFSHAAEQYRNLKQETADVSKQYPISTSEKKTQEEPVKKIPGLGGDDDDHEMTDVKTESISASAECAEMEVDRLIQNAKAQVKIGQKRKADQDGEGGEVDDAEGSQTEEEKRGPRPKRKRKSQGPKTPKNALMQLNEIKPGLVFETVSQSGPVHSPVFTVKVNVNGTDFDGSGTSKKRAKLQAAERALTSFVQFNNPSEAHIAMGRNVVGGDFTNDADELADAIMIDFGGNPPGSHLPNGANGTTTPGQRRTKELPQPKNPLMILNELKPGIKYDFVSETGDGINKCFVMSVSVDGKTFEGSGRNKKLAKNRAAQNALEDVYNMDFSLISVGRDGQEQLPKTLADHMMKLVFDKFTELTDASGSNYARRKVLAGFIVSEGLERENARVVSLATGTKCINGEYISDQGLALNDCHAEIIARRSFKRYLYDQLKLLLGPEREQSIFEAKPTSGYKLKENIQVHLYISTSPCGDARIFSPHETPPDGTESDKHPNRKARGQLRTKIESGEGTIPVKSSPPVQTWDGVLQGERLLTMSCSDKVCKWNALGLQGSLLSHFIDPVYLNGIILGSLFHVDHMSRAMYGRVSPSQSLPEPYRVNKPYLSGISHPESRQPGKAPSFSINWTVGDEKLEVINCTTGKDEQEQPSQVCKQALFRLFRDLYGKLIASTPPVTADQLSVYGEMKSLVHGYEAVKEMLYKMFRDAGFGIWVGKPIEQDLFSLSN